MNSRPPFHSNPDSQPFIHALNAFSGHPSMLDLPLPFLNRPAASHTTSPWLLVLMHGVGSNEGDLFGLAPYVPRISMS